MPAQNFQLFEVNKSIICLLEKEAYHDLRHDVRNVHFLARADQSGWNRLRADRYVWAPGREAARWLDWALPGYHRVDDRKRVRVSLLPPSAVAYCRAHFA